MPSMVFVGNASTPVWIVVMEGLVFPVRLGFSTREVVSGHVRFPLSSISVTLPVKTALIIVLNVRLQPVWNVRAGC